MIEFDEEAARKVREKELAQRGVQQSKANEQAEKKRKSALAQVKQPHEAYLNKVKQDNYVNSKRLYDCSGIFSEMDKSLSDKALCWEVMNFSDWHRGSKSKKIFMCVRKHFVFSYVKSMMTEKIKTLQNSIGLSLILKKECCIIQNSSGEIRVAVGKLN